MLGTIFLFFPTSYQSLVSLWCLSLGVGIVLAWYRGGFYQTVAQWVLAVVISIMVAASVTVVVDNLWDGFESPWYPWLVMTRWQQLELGSLEWGHWVIVVIAISGVFIMAWAWFILYWLNRHKGVLGSAHFATDWEIQKADLWGNEGIILGQSNRQPLRLPGYESVLVVAPTGSGKTRGIAIPNLMTWRGSIVANDLKGELYDATASYRENHLGNQCYCWAPANVDGSPHGYNPFFYVSDNPDLRIRDLQLIAEMLIPQERADGGFWTASSRDLFLMLALYQFETKGMATLAGIHDLSKRENFFEWLEMQLDEGIMIDEAGSQLAYSLLQADADKTRPNILKDFHSRMTLFMDPLVRVATSSCDFDMRNLRREKMSIYLNIPDSDQERLKPLVTLFWAQMVHVMTQAIPDIDTEPYGVLAVLDEFGNMGKIPKLQKGLSFLRGYRVRSVILVQYLGQLYSVYGQHDARSFLNAKAKVIYALNDIEDAKYFSEAMGYKTVTVRSRGVSHGERQNTSKAENLQRQPLVSQFSLLHLCYQHQVIMLEGRPPIWGSKC
ncbi:MAG: hypothetical protein CMF50_03745 [Legionellales bacterium]|nr:hypothetical protein [Legionellales bacterium]